LRTGRNNSPLETMRDFGSLTEELKGKNVRLSHQRVKVLEYLDRNRIHPTADQIYCALHAEMPSLSRTTVYNALNSLVNADLVKMLTIESNEARYDIVTETHGHFKCEQCGKIQDFPIDLQEINPEGLKGCKIQQKNVYFKGLCRDCINQPGSDHH